MERSIVGARTNAQLVQHGGSEQFFVWLGDQLLGAYPDTILTKRAGPELVLPPWADDHPELVQGLWEFTVFSEDRYEQGQT